MDPLAYGSTVCELVTSLRQGVGASTEEIMRAVRWRKLETVNVYGREFNPAARNSVMRLGL
ncbi:hypothetical protein OIU91_03825 [Streptomyces sp. NBC_01456]|uniref:hypothetical protein n=1 Tax=unclassified Streptomyces TaxID=2593676 RepID=UPI002E341081|nr:MULTISPECIES: hypothetical protein [unclassified Streptomyces]